MGSSGPQNYLPGSLPTHAHNEPSSISFISGNSRSTNSSLGSSMNTNTSSNNNSTLSSHSFSPAFLHFHQKRQQRMMRKQKQKHNATTNDDDEENNNTTNDDFCCPQQHLYNAYHQHNQNNNNNDDWCYDPYARNANAVDSLRTVEQVTSLSNSLMVTGTTAGGVTTSRHQSLGGSGAQLPIWLQQTKNTSATNNNNSKNNNSENLAATSGDNKRRKNTSQLQNGYNILSDNLGDGGNGSGALSTTPNALVAQASAASTPFNSARGPRHLSVSQRIRYLNNNNNNNTSQNHACVATNNLSAKHLTLPGDNNTSNCQGKFNNINSASPTSLFFGGHHQFSSPTSYLMKRVAANGSTPSSYLKREHSLLAVALANGENVLGSSSSVKFVDLAVVKSTVSQPLHVTTGAAAAAAPSTPITNKRQLKYQQQQEHQNAAKNEKQEQNENDKKKNNKNKSSKKKHHHSRKKNSSSHHQTKTTKSTTVENRLHGFIKFSSIVLTVSFRILHTKYLLNNKKLDPFCETAERLQALQNANECYLNYDFFGAARILDELVTTRIERQWPVLLRSQGLTEQAVERMRDLCIELAEKAEIEQEMRRMKKQQQKQKQKMQEERRNSTRRRRRNGKETGTGAANLLQQQQGHENNSRRQRRRHIMKSDNLDNDDYVQDENGEFYYYSDEEDNHFDDDNDENNDNIEDDFDDDDDDLLPNDDDDEYNEQYEDPEDEEFENLIYNKFNVVVDLDMIGSAQCYDVDHYYSKEDC